MFEQIILFIASLFANTMSAFAGGGAGLVQFPVLLFLGLPFSVALATHKVATVALGLGSTYRYFKNPGDYDWKIAGWILLCGVPGTILGAFIIVQTPDRIAELCLGIITISIGIYSACRKTMGLTSEPKNRDLRGYIIGGVLMFLIGVYNGSLSSGSGMFLTLLLILWYGFDYKSAVMYMITAGGLFWNASGAVSVVAFGQYIEWSWMPALLLGSFLGGYLGSHLGILKGSTWIKRAFEAVTILTGLYLLVRYFYGA
ncbi:MAG: sulfite exporter TauE/SafE family protein [Alphaproteobacteria bacterium]|jgi:uncharacterized membrane protein YfcA|nr:sulfite exporter TauE/SafE family protein [Alphaproteobacteria bacterium]